MHGQNDANDPSRTFGSSILPAAIGRGRIDRFSSCGLGPSPSGLALAAGLVQHPAASQHPHTVRPVRLARCSLGLQRREEALHRRIVPDVAGTADRTDDAVIAINLCRCIGYRDRNDAVARQDSVQILSRSTSTPNCFLKQHLMAELKPASHVVLTYLARRPR